MQALTFLLPGFLLALSTHNTFNGTWGEWGGEGFGRGGVQGVGSTHVPKPASSPGDINQ